MEQEKIEFGGEDMDVDQKLDVDLIIPHSSTSSKAKCIKRLDEAVVNKIAAGEVVVRPSAALKELIENSIDAEEGGLQTLQIQDDGHGIRVEDYPILCERFTTSKISKYQDLAKVASFGFRGEALASISLVGKLEITSRTSEQDVAYKAYFENCILVPGNGGNDPTPIACAGHIGTIIKATDLFYRNLQRKKSFSKKEEYMQIIEVVMSYATHFCKINFVLKSLENNNISVSTGNIIKEGRSDNEIRKETIRRLYGGVNEYDLFDYTHTHSTYNLKINMVCSKVNAKTSVKRNSLILFINNRLVKCEKIKKAVDNAYHGYLPKNYCYFVYLSLEMNPKDIDVNVHPTKKEVGFCNQDAIADMIEKFIENELRQQNDSINYGVPMSTPDNKRKSDANSPKKKQSKRSKKKSKTERKLKKKGENGEDVNEEDESCCEGEGEDDNKENGGKVEQWDMVRIDHRDSTLESFLMHGKIDPEIYRQKASGKEYGINNPVVFMTNADQIQSQELVETPNNVMNLTTVISCNLLSIRKLIYEFEHDIDDDYSQMFKHHKYCGMISYIIFYLSNFFIKFNFCCMIKS